MTALFLFFLLKGQLLVCVANISLDGLANVDSRCLIWHIHSWSSRGRMEAQFAISLYFWRNIH